MKMGSLDLGNKFEYVNHKPLGKKLTNSQRNSGQWIRQGQGMPMNSTGMTKNWTIDGEKDKLINFVGDSQIFESHTYLKNINCIEETSRNEEEHSKLDINPGKYNSNTRALQDKKSDRFFKD